MSNGQNYIPAAQPPGEHGVPIPMEPVEKPLITINQINLTWKQLAAMGTLIAGLFAAGTLYVPAKSADLTALSAVVQVMVDEQKKLTTAVNTLDASVRELRDAPARVIERRLKNSARGLRLR